MRPILLKLYRYFNHSLKICMCFLQNPEFIFVYFFYIFTLDFLHGSEFVVGTL